MTCEPTRKVDPMQSPLWHYALSIYAEPDVAPACLVLQEHAGLGKVFKTPPMHEQHQQLTRQSEHEPTSP
jgi:uncharacterized protein (TIGR02444 family)